MSKRSMFLNPTHPYSDDPDPTASAETLIYELPAVGGKIGVDVAAVETSVATGATGNHVAVLKGDPARKFVPSRIVVTGLTTATGDAEITVGTTVGGVDLLTATALTGVTAAGKSLPIAPVAGALPSIAGNAPLHIAVTSADTTTAARVMVTIEGTLVG